MDELEQQAQREREAQLASERLLVKMRMEKQDEICITNPLNEPYVIKNFGDDQRERFVFPAHNEDIGYGPGKKVVPRYVAKRFYENVFAILVGRFNEDFLAKEKAKWKGNILDWPEYQRSIEKHYAGRHATVKEMQDKFFPLFEWKLVRKYGLDELPANTADKTYRESDVNSLDDMIANAEKENPPLSASSATKSFAEQVAA